MSPQTQEINDLLRQLVEAFIDYPSHLSLAAKEVPGAVFWSLQGHADDHSKLVGKGGAHVKALGFIVKEIGKNQDTMYTFKLSEPEPAARRESSPPRLAESYAPRKAAELLDRMLECMCFGQHAVETKVDTGKMEKGVLVTPHTFTFTIFTRDDADYKELVTAPGSDGMTVVGALGTIFRAYANKDGVRFILDVRRP